MKIEAQGNPELASLSQLLEHFTTAMLTNADAAGALVSHPMTPLEMDAEGTLWFFTDARYTLAADLLAVNVSFADAGTSTFVSMAGRGELLRDQGRIEAFNALGYLEIPALVVEASKEDLLIMSLVENMARRYPAPGDLIIEIDRLKNDIAPTCGS